MATQTERTDAEREREHEGKRARLTLDLDPALHMRIKMAAAQQRLSMREYIERILRETQHNLSRAARILDIDRTTLYNKLRRYGLR